MKTVNSILGIILSLTFLLSGCMKDDIDELRRQQAENEERLTALEDWQKSTNNQIASLQGLISALENNDYVTGVSPVKEGGVEVGYTISFSKSSPITIFHGKKGEKGDAGKDAQAPSIGIAKHTDSKYYWTLDGQWLLDESGKKIPVTGDKGDKGDQGNQGATGSTGAQGQNGVTPKVAIGSDNYWYISANGTATGIPPATGWTSTGVKATGATGIPGPAGPVGPKGDQGDAIFAANGIDLTNDDYVLFTLADAITTIKLPKYKSIGIAFDQPGIFAAGATQTIAYTSTGTVEPTTIRVVDVPTGWKVTINSTQKTFTVVAPTAITADNFERETTVLIGNGNDIAAMYGLLLRSTGAAENEIGACYYEKGVVIGMVYIKNDGTSGSGKVVSLDESALSWCNSGGQSGAINMDNGMGNMQTIQAEVNIGGKNWTDFPSFNWVHNVKNKGIPDYNNNNGIGIWYFPSRSELEHLFCVYNGQPLETWTAWNSYPSWGANIVAANTAFNNKLTTIGGTAFSAGYYWSSSEDGIGVWCVNFGNGFLIGALGNAFNNSTRAILCF